MTLPNGLHSTFETTVTQKISLLFHILMLPNANSSNKPRFSYNELKPNLGVTKTHDDQGHCGSFLIVGSRGRSPAGCRRFKSLPQLDNTFEFVCGGRRDASTICPCVDKKTASGVHAHCGMFYFCLEHVLGTSVTCLSRLQQRLEQGWSLVGQVCNTVK